ncbi:MAG: PAS domain-containing protein [Gemmataceae bacterium]
MSDRPIRVLLVDDDEDDFALTRYLLADIKGGEYVLDWAPVYEDALAAIARREHDVYLLDYRLGEHSGVELLREAQRRGGRGPFLLLTGQGQRELDLEAMQAGAADYLEKGQLTAALLERSIRYAIERWRHADELERRVAERTAELAEANARLREEAASRERAAAALRLSEERFRLAAEAVNGIIYDCDLLTGRAERTRGLKEVLGYAPEDVPATVSWWHEQIHPEDLAAVLEANHRQADRAEASYVSEYRVRHRDGRYLHVVDRGLIVRGRDGQPTRVVGCTQDVSNLRRAEEALRISRERLDLVVQSTELGLWYCDLPFDRLLWNDKCKEHFGLPPWSEVTIETFFQHLHPDDRERTRQAIGHSIDQDTPYDIIYRTLTPGGQQRWVRAIGRSFRDRVGQPIRFDGVTVDVTQQKQVEMAVHRRSEQLQELARIATGLNIAEDVGKMLRLLSEAARELIGAHQAAISHVIDEDGGRAISVVSLSDRYAAWRDHGAPPDRSGLSAVVCETNHTVRLTQAQVEAHPRWKGSGSEPARRPPLRGWLASPLVARGGKNLGLIQLSDKYEGDFTTDDEALLIQMAQMASAALENARLYQDLRETDRLKTEFLAMLAHELRNPLAPIRNALYFVRLHQREGQGDEVREAYSMMERQLEHLIRLVDDLLDVSRITRGMITLQKEAIELSSVVTRAVECARPLIDARGHRLEVRLPVGPMPLEGDPVRLTQVVLNLLNNAARYTPRGGAISLEVERETGEGGVPTRAAVRVRDTGIGIPAPMLSRIFDLFTQVDRTIRAGRGRAGGRPGAGPPAGENARRHRRGRGVRARAGAASSSSACRCPPRRAAPATPATAGRAPTAFPSVVDEQRDSANSLAKLLGVMSARFGPPASSRETLAEVAAHVTEVVVLDLGMPGMTGFEVARHVRSMSGVAQPLPGGGDRVRHRRGPPAVARRGSMPTW